MSHPQSRIRPEDQVRLGVGGDRLPSLSAIRAFEAAARLGSFAKAALELDTTAASVSYHVRRLERQIGVKLFLRRSQSVELTEPGKLLATEATNAFAVLRAGFINARDTDASHLVLTTLPSFGAAWLTPRLGQFRAKYPKIIVELDLSETAHDLAESRFDAAIRNGHGRWPGLRTIKLFPSIFMPLCAPALQEAARSITDPNAATKVALLGRADWWALWYKAQGHEDIPLKGRFKTNLPVEHLDIALAVAGHGVAIGSPILFRKEISAGRLVPAHDFVAGDGRSFWLTYPAAVENRAKIVRFREWLCDEVSRDLDAARHYLNAAVIVV